MLFRKNFSVLSKLRENKFLAKVRISQVIRPSVFIAAWCILSSLAYGQTVTGPWPAALLYQKDGDTLDRLGNLVAGAGDVNADGYDDFAIGAAEADPGGLTSAGSAFIYSGLDGSLLYQKNGAVAGDNFGRQVAGAGNVNGDGYADFIVGAPLADPNDSSSAGSVYVYSGLDGSLLFQKNGARAGDIMGGGRKAGNVNGDGRDDFIIAAPLADPNDSSSAGSVYVYSGLDGSLIYQKNGTHPGDQLGGLQGLGRGGDVNKDGRDDFILGAPTADPGGFTSAGSAFVYSGLTGSLLYQKNGDTASQELGNAVAADGDANGDGNADFIVGANRRKVSGVLNVGSVFVYSGLDGSLLYQKDGSAASDIFGFSVAWAGDVNADGKDDFIIGANMANPGGINDAGSVFIYSGSDGSLLFQIDGDNISDRLGSSVAGAGDVNGDGRDDIIVAAPDNDPSGVSQAGSAFVFVSGYAERILSIADIPNDQGKEVRTGWKSLPGNNSLVTQFVIFRRIDGSLSAKTSRIFTGSAFPPGSWEQVGNFLAFGDTLYNGVVPTLVDSTSGGIQYSAFFVRAATSDPLVFFDSPIDSGYSVDNLVPSPPPNLQVAHAPGGIALNWGKVLDEDFDFFYIYRDTVSSFTLSPGKRIKTTSDTTVVDSVSEQGKTYFYRATAVDFSGNEGPSSNEATAGPLCTDKAGDANGSGGAPNLTDIIYLVNYVFKGGPAPSPLCQGDANGSGGAPNLTDIIYLVNYVFKGGPAPINSGVCCL